MRALLANTVLRRFALTQLLLEVQFWFPVWLIFLTGRGFSITTAVLADGVFRLTVVALELPLGIVADRVGRRRAYLALPVLAIATFVAISLVETTPVLFVVWVLWGVLWALNSGTASAYLYELVIEHTEGVDVTKAFGGLRVVTSLAVLASHLSAGWLYRLDERAPFLITAGLAVAAGLVTLALPEIHGSRRPHAGLRTVVHDLRVAWAGEALRRSTILAVLLLSFGWTATILFQPLILDLGLSTAAAGVVYFGYSAMAMLAGIGCGMVGASRRQGLTTAGFVLLSAAVVGTAVLPELGPYVFIPVMGLGYYLSWTLLEVTVNERAQTSVRATIASGISLVGGIVIAVGRPTLGALADRASAATAFAVWAVVGVGVTIAAIALNRRVTAETA